MRIIAGSLGGRPFDAPRGHRTHPMSDKVRGALFNMLGDIKDLTVLDAFAGSGALSYEAVSRGAGRVTAIDQDMAAQQAIAANIKALGLNDRIKLIKAPAGAWLRTTAGTNFNVVLCDPPYDDLQLSLLQRLTATVQPEGLLVLSWPGGQELPELPALTRIADRQYGDAALAIYRRPE